MPNLFNTGNNNIKLLLKKLEDSYILDYSNQNIKLSDNEIWKDIQSLDKEIRIKLALYALERLVISDFEERHYKILRKRVFRSEINRKKNLLKKTTIKIFNILLKSTDIEILPISEILFTLEYHKKNYGADNTYNSVIKHFDIKWRKTLYPCTEFKKLRQGILKLDRKNKNEFCFNTTDIIGKRMIINWNSLTDEIKTVICHCWDQPFRSKPTKSWLKKSKELIQNSLSKDYQIDIFYKCFEYLEKHGKSLVNKLNSKENFIDADSILEEALSNFPKPNEQSVNDSFFKKISEIIFGERIANNETHNDDELYLNKENETGISYLIWYASLMNSNRLNSIIGSFALSSFKKIKNVGSLSIRNGNACLYAFDLMPINTGIVYFFDIQHKVPNKKVKKLAENYIQKKAKELNLSEDYLLEFATQDFGIINNKIEKTFGVFKAIIDISKIKKPTISWLNTTSNKILKTVPSLVKSKYKSELIALKIKQKEISVAIKTHSKRLENSYINDVSWEIKEWRNYYINHAFLSLFNAVLIWQFDENVIAIYNGSDFINQNQEIVDIDKYTSVRLWHPIYSDVNIVQKWREFILEYEIMQPFKQAFREIYKITEAEIETNTYSNRFAAHILYQHQFKTLTTVRNWNYSLQGGFDSHNTPTKNISKFKMKAEFLVEPIEDSLNEMSIYSYVSSDLVQFSNNQEILAMESIPEIVFTEIMRDIDLFVSVCSIGNDPNWQKGGNKTRNYWNDYSFGDLSNNGKTRKAVLKLIIPKLKIFEKCKITDKFLEVKGTLKTYKIHLGSGNILMSPNDEYLCIVPDNKNKTKHEIFLPFDDDKTLSIIISKAFMLAEDVKIKDKTIISQITKQ